MRGFLGAVSLLTRVPARSDAPSEKSVPWLPVVGALIGALVALIYALTRSVLSPFAAATLAIGAGVLVTGALHEDGLADCADAFGARAGRGRTLEILKDPVHGTYGVAAIALTIAARIAAVGGIGASAALVAVPAAHALGRATAGPMMWLLPPATTEGLGGRYAARVARREAVAAAVVGAIVAVGLLGWWGLAAVFVAAVAAVAAAAPALRSIGGVTGDVFGAAEQLTEIGVLFLALAVRGSLPWWRG